MKKMLRDNAIKNVIVIILLILSYLVLEPFLRHPSFAADKAAVGSMLTAVGILAVVACFGNFAFTYEYVNRRSFESKILAHITTGLLMYLIGLSLEMTSLLSKLLIGSFPMFDLSLVVLYIASILYDFWDLKRAG